MRRDSTRQRGSKRHEREFAQWQPRCQAEAVAPIQNKIGHFFGNPILRAILGQPINRQDLRKIMDDGWILIVSLNKGGIGGDASTMLGSLLVSGPQLAATSRADICIDAMRRTRLWTD